MIAHPSARTPAPSKRLGLATHLDRAAFAVAVLLAVVFPFERIRPVLALAGGLALTSVEGVLLATLAVWAGSRLIGWRRPQVPPGLALPALLWMAALLISAVAAPDYRLDALKFSARTATGLLAGWAVYDLVASSQQASLRWRILCWAMAVAGLAVTVLGLAEVLQWEPAVRWLGGFKKAPTYVGDLLRVSASLGYATVAAMVLELTLPLLLAWVLTARTLWLRVLLAVAVVAQMAVLVMTWTRGGMVALFAGLLVMAGLAWQRKLRRVSAGSLAAAAALAALLGVLLLANPLAGLRFKSESEAGWYRAGYQAPPVVTIQAGARRAVPVEVTNAGVRTWTTGGSQPFALSYHLRHVDGRMIEADGLRTALPQAVAPGGRLRLQAVLAAPQTAGEYWVEWDMVHEEVTWFSAKGAEPGRSRLIVTSRQDGIAGETPQAEASALRLPPTGRMQLWRTALRMAWARPLLGVGPDNFRLVYGDYAGVAVWDSTIHANNLYLEWLAGTGIVGAMLFAWLTIAIAAGALRALRRANPHHPNTAYQTWQLALIAALAAWYVHGALDSFFEFTPTLVAFWMIAGLALCTPPLAVPGENDDATGI